jgi:hypothetical protein
LGTAATNPATAFQPSSSSLTNLAANNGSSLTSLTAANITGTIAISNGGSGATTAGGARTNLGGTAVGNSVFTAINAEAAATAIGVGGSNSPPFLGAYLNDSLIINGTNPQLIAGPSVSVRLDGALGLQFQGTSASTLSATTRTNLGLGWTALTNTNTAGFNTSLYGSGTNPVLYDTNGEVVSPTNFWQVAPIVTSFVESQPTTNQTTNISAARNLHIHSIAFSTVGITNTIALPTTNSFNGDIALVVHQGPTSSVTAVRTAGAGTNLITLNQFEEAVEFVYYNNVWQLNHNLSYIEPIFFSGTNATANAAASRTNLGLPLTALTNTDVTNFRTSIGLGTTNNVAFSNIVSSGTLTSTGVVTAVTNLNVGGAIAVTNAAATRTNLGIPLAALTNTNTAGFQRAILQTNSTPAAGANLGDAKAWLEISVVTNNVTNSFRIPVFQ